MEYKDYYAILGVPKTASQAEIKKAYRKQARELHPDRNPGDTEAERKFKAANEANAVLSDPEQRRRYDELGANWQAYEQTVFDPQGASSWGGFGGAPGGTRWTYRTSSAEDLGGFSDFFNAFFGGAGTPGGGAAPGGGVRGATGGRPGNAGGPFEYVDFGGSQAGQRRRAAAPTATARAEVTLAEVVRGAERMVAVNGRRLHVKIPPGVSDGSKIKLSGAVDGGDLLITVAVQPDPRFERRGADLTTEVPVSLADALLGADVKVPTPTGSVKTRIRPNTQNGQEIRLAGRGLPHRGKSDAKGDLIVKVRVVLPKLDDDAREAFRTFAQEHLEVRTE